MKKKICFLSLLAAAFTAVMPVSVAPAQVPMHPGVNSLLVSPAMVETPGPAAEPRDYPGAVTVTVITPVYTYPMSVSLNGERVAGAYFGGAANYYWTASSGLVQVSGTVGGVSETGVIGGEFSNATMQYNGSNVNTAGTWDPLTLLWTFPGMNPAAPALFATDYNSGWDITSDGSTIVGLQWLPGYDYSAFRWSSGSGYTMIGSGVGQGSRASGISANGLTVYGWAEVASTSRTPVVWHNGQAIFISSTEAGEAYGASPDGLHVTGTVGSNGFIWTPQGVTNFTNTLMTGQMYPTAVLNDGTVFGYIVTSWPPAPNARRAFVREPSGQMKTFNDYAGERGLENAQSWLFYSINDATEDGMTVVGAGKDPQGQAITFLMTFPDLQPVFTAYPVSLDFGDVPAGTQTPYQDLHLANTGGGTLVIQNVILVGEDSDRFTADDPNIYPKSVGLADSISLSVAFHPLTPGPHTAAVEVETSVGTYLVPLSGNGTPGVGIGETSLLHLSLSPVPAVSLLEVRTGGVPGRIRIFDSLGRQRNAGETDGKGPVIVDVSRLPKGIYQLQFTGGNGETVSRPFMTVDY